MAAFLADQNFEDEVVLALIGLGHDILTARAVGLDRAADADLLAAATTAGRAILTHDRDYRVLHKAGAIHAGILFATVDQDFDALAARIHHAVVSLPDLIGQLIRIVRPNSYP
jgi:predicted nuclease of predicted toxin-antitoxin system